MLEALKKHSTIVSLIFIGIITVITYGILIPQLGYYQDDWYLIWAGQTGGLSDVIALFTTDRPFMGWVYAVAYKLLGDGIIGWHLWALLFKLFGVYGVFWLLQMLWPKEKFLKISVLLIFIVYPGFLSQPIANTFQNHLLTYGAAIWSIAFGVAAIKFEQKPLKVFFLFSSVTLTAFYLPIYEYMIGLEGAKIVFFWLVHRKKKLDTWKLSVKKVGLWYLPHLVVSLIFLYWRIFIFQSTRITTNEAALLSNYRSNLGPSLLRLGVETVKDFIDTVVHVWSYSLYSNFDLADYADLGQVFFLAIVVVGISAIYLFKILKTNTSEDIRQKNKQLILLGIWTVVVTLLPMVIAGRNVRFGGFERYTLQASLGVALLLTGVLLYIRPRMRETLLLVLVFIGVATQVSNAQNWANLWQKHRNIWWQVSWRAPDLKTDTLFIVSGFNIEQDYEGWVPLNMIYSNDPAQIKPEFDVELLYNKAVVRSQVGVLVNGATRHIDFQKNYSQLMLVTKPSDSSCVHFIDQNLPAISLSDSPLVNQVADYSDLNNILTDQGNNPPPIKIFGSEPEHGWCYYYQKISLARQLADWQNIVNLAEEAEQMGLKPDDPIEWLPIIEGYVMAGNLEMAAQIANNIRFSQDIKVPLCLSLDANSSDLEAIASYDRLGMIEVLCTGSAD